jgi:Transcriptional regulator PadR-like family
VGRRSGFSAQTLSVLAALCEQPSEWRHGYELAKRTGLKSGTLYPILMRLADRGLMEARWQEEQPAGRPGGISTGLRQTGWPAPAPRLPPGLPRRSRPRVPRATLPWIVGRTRGAVSRGRLARLVRTGGYAAIFALVLVRTAVRRVADAPPNNL